MVAEVTAAAFSAQDGNKKNEIIFILHKAPYHHGTVDDWKRPLVGTKAVNTTLLRDQGVVAITVQCDGARNDLMVPEEGRHFGRAPRRPSLQEIQSETFRMV